MVNSPEVSWAPPQSPLPSPLGSPLPEAGIPASPRRPGFRERLSDLAAEYEELQAHCERLAAENRDLRSRLAATQPDGEGRRRQDSIMPLPTATVYTTDEKDHDGGARDSLALEDKEGKGDLGREDREAREVRKAEGPSRTEVRTVDHVAERHHAKQSEGGGNQGAHRSSARGSGDGGAGAVSGDEESGSSGSSSGSEGGHSHGKRGGRRRRHRRRHSHGGHRRRRRHGRSRSRSARSRSRRGKSPPRRDGPLVARGLYGSGDHRRDVEDFCMKNQLEARVISALKSMPESKQRKVMGTDGGENCYLLVDRVKNPNAVVMSRIRKIEAE